MLFLVETKLNFNNIVTARYCSIDRTIFCMSSSIVLNLLNGSCRMKRCIDYDYVPDERSLADDGRVWKDEPSNRVRTIILTQHSC